MCTVPPVTEKMLLAHPSEAVGLACPLCLPEPPSAIGYMKFLDPHGVERVDAQLFECAARRHSFTLAGGALRLLAADGKRPASPRLFHLAEGRLAEAAAK